MLVFRSIALGLLGACFLLLATRQTDLRVERELVPVPQPAPPASATIIDVAHGVSANQVVQLVRLLPNEHVVAVDDRPVAGDLDAGAMIAANEVSARTFVDLTVSGGGGGERRVLVLLH